MGFCRLPYKSWRQKASPIPSAVNVPSALISGGYTQKIVGLQACSTDKRAIHIRNLHQLRRIVGLHRTAVKNAHPAAIVCKTPFEVRADRGMHGCDIFRRRGQAGADRPDRFISDHNGLRARTLRQRTLKLREDHGDGIARLALLAGFADADDGSSSCPYRSPGFRTDRFVAFAMIGAAFRMADDNGACTAVHQHLRRNIPRMRAFFMVMAILCSDHDGAAIRCHRLDERCRRTDHQIDAIAKIGPVSRLHQVEFGKSNTQPVHLPVARQKWFYYHFRPYPIFIQRYETRVYQNYRRRQVHRAPVADKVDGARLAT